MTKAEYRRTRHWRDRREAVLKRDGRRCAFCECAINGRVHVHHVDDSPERYDEEGIDNLVVLCSSCHAYVSKKFERRKNIAEVAPLLRMQLARVLRRYNEFYEEEE